MYSWLILKSSMRDSDFSEDLTYNYAFRGQSHFKDIFETSTELYRDLGIPFTTYLSVKKGAA